MSLSEREEGELARLARALEQDDPNLARKLRRPVLDPRTAQTTLSLRCLAMIAFGLGVTALGVRLGAPGYTAFGVTFATCAPISFCVWCHTRFPNR